MPNQPSHTEKLFEPLELPCGLILKNRMVKSAMSDSLGDGVGNPTDAQIKLYERWAHGGVAVAIIGEVQCSPYFAEKPGNLVLNAESDHEKFKSLAKKGCTNESHLWLQLGHAGAMADPAISSPKGPSAIDVPGLCCDALTIDEIRQLPDEFARSALLAQQNGFTGVQIHAAHGFLLSQFLSPLFNKRKDEYGGLIESRTRLLLEIIDKVRSTVAANFVVALKLNSTDQLEGGLQPLDALKVITVLNGMGVDLIDVSGGTYFPGAKSASDSTGSGPYFVDFATRARQLTKTPIMVTGGFKKQAQALDAVAKEQADIIGLARTLVLDPELPNKWQLNVASDPMFPQFVSPPEGGITAWYTMRISQLANGNSDASVVELESVLREYNERDRLRAIDWVKRFDSRSPK